MKTAALSPAQSYLDLLDDKRRHYGWRIISHTRYIDHDPPENLVPGFEFLELVRGLCVDVLPMGFCLLKDSRKCFCLLSSHLWVHGDEGERQLQLEMQGDDTKAEMGI